MSLFPDAAIWRAACATDASLAAWSGPWAVCFAISSGADTTVFELADGKVQPTPGDPVFTLAAPDPVWAKFLLPVPPRHHHGIFAMHYRNPDFTIQGDQLAFMQHAHIARRILEIGKWLGARQPNAGAGHLGAPFRSSSDTKRPGRLRAGHRRWHDLPNLS